MVGTFSETSSSDGFHALTFFSFSFFLFGTGEKTSSAALHFVMTFYRSRSLASVMAAVEAHPLDAIALSGVSEGTRLDWART